MGGTTGEHLRHLAISPREADCGDSIVLSLSMTTAARGIPKGGLLAIDCPGYLGASRPQFLYQEQEGFVSVDLTAPDLPWQGAIATADRKSWVRTREDYEPLVEKKYRPYRLIGLVFPEGVAAGVGITVRLGAGAGGFGTGYKVGVVAPRPGFQHRFLVRLYETPDAPEPIEEHPLSLRVHARVPVRAMVVRHAAGGTHVLFRDRFENPAPVCDPTRWIAVSGGRPRANEHGMVVLDEPDTGVRARGALNLSPCAPMREVFGGYNIYWGDLHTHSGYSCDCKATERSEVWPADMLRFGRHAAALDFMALTDHHFVDRPAKALSEQEWIDTVRACREADDPGAFVAIPGIEYRCERGDTVALFGEAPEYAEITRPEDDRIDRFWRSLRGRDFLTIPHFHNPGSLPEGTWIAPDEPAVEPVMEVFSCHGRFDEPPHDGMALAPPAVKLLRADRNADYLLRRGYRYGIMCSSDGHKGRPGTNGLVAVFTSELSREALFEALRERRCYGTTNARIRLLFTVNDRLMGSEIAGASRLRFRLQVHGTAPIRWVEVLRSGRLHRRFAPAAHTLEETWEEADDESAWFMVRLVQEDQAMAFSSPVWVDP